MPNNDVQTELSFSSTRESATLVGAPLTRHVRLGLALDHRAWLRLLADEWWPLSGPSTDVRLGVGSARGDTGQAEGRIPIIAWLDPAKLPAIDVASWRDSAWQRVPLSSLTHSDEEISWPGPVPLFAISSFSVASESDGARLTAMAKGFSNIEPPAQRIEVGRVDVLPSAATKPPEFSPLSPPRYWNALRGAASMATCSVPAVGPWLEVLCASLALTDNGSAASQVNAPWWVEPPWRRSTRPQDADSLQLRLWCSVIDVLLEVHLREAWRPKLVLEGVVDRACSHYDVALASLESLVAETHALLDDERTVNVARMHADPVGLALQLVLLRPTPDRFIHWRNDLRDLPPAVWWTGSVLSGLLRGYTDLETTFRGPAQGRRRLALRTWYLSTPERRDMAHWPGITDSTPGWQREPACLSLLWDGEPWAERTENYRGRWFAADLKRGEVRQAAIELVSRLNPSCLRRRLRFADVLIPWSGSGVIRPAEATARELAVDGEIWLDLPAQTSIVTDLDEDQFRTWLIQASISERLPEPPSGASGRSPMMPTSSVKRPRTGVVERPHDRRFDYPELEYPDPASLRRLPTAMEAPGHVYSASIQHHAELSIASASGQVPGLLIVQNFISDDEERELLEVVGASPWQNDMARRVQHYGWRYDYRAKRVDAEFRLGPLPQWAARLGERLLKQGLVEELPDQVIVNEYVGKQGITKHVDCLPCFRGAIAMVSLGESWEMFFWSPDGKRKVVLTLDRRSAVVLTGEAREKWKHEIPRRPREPWGPRGSRVSLTFRKVKVLAERGQARSKKTRGDAPLLDRPRSRGTNSRLPITAVNDETPPEKATVVTSARRE